MCRDNDHGGRRCPSDTSENRNLRRHNQNAITRHHEERTTQLITADTAVPAPAVEPELTFEQKKEALVTEAKKHAEDVKRYMDPDGYNPKAAEVSTRKAGAALQSLSDLIAGKPYAEEVAEAQSSLVEAKAEEDRIYAELVALNRERTAAQHEELVAKEAQMDSTGKWSEEDQAKYVARIAEVKASFAERVRDKNAEYAAATKKAQEIARGDAAKEIKLRHRKALLEAISTVRELGGEVKVASNSNKDAAKSLQEAVAEVYPKDWIDASNADNSANLRVLKTPTRAHYTSASRQTTKKSVPKYSLSTWKDQVEEAQTPGTRLYATGAQVIPPGEKVTVRDGREYDNRYQREAAVVVPRVTWHSPGFRQPEVPQDEDAPRPAGSGWKKALVDEGAGKPVVRWYKNQTTSVTTDVRTQAELTVSGFKQRDEDGGEAVRRVALHEFAHRVEGTPQGRRLFVLQEKFLERRTTGADGQRERLTSIYPTARKRELGYKDDFVHHYMGKVYETSNREVLSMGVESVFGDSQGSLMGWGGTNNGDQDMRNFIVGLWASV